MSGTTVFTTIQWVGIGFIFLWFLGSSMKEGLWNNAITCFNAFVAGTVGLVLGLAIAKLLAWVVGMAGFKPEPGNPWLGVGMFMVAMWLAYIGCYLVLSTLTDHFSQVRVTFHPVINGIGSFVFICGTTSVLFVYSSFGFLVVKLATG